jgi:Holliday junction resolvase RusA-like endonuclease
VDRKREEFPSYKNVSEGFLMYDNDKKIMLLQMRQVKKALHIELRGRLYKTGNRGFRRAQVELIRQIRDDANRLNWSMVPRARIAVKIQFFPSKNSQVPEIQNLVKTYLDLLKGVVFKDDRQISYLSAYCFRSGKHAKNTHSKKGHVYIRVEKFADLLETYKLYFNTTAPHDYELS